MAYFVQKVLAGVIAVWSIAAVSWLDIGFGSSEPRPAGHPASEPYLGMEQPTEAANAPYEPLETTQTTITTIAGCDDVVRLGASLGWPAEELATLRRIANAESGCMPWAHNQTDPHGGSYGLMQVNGFWCLPNSNWPIGWLQAQGIVATCDDLFSATANLSAALAIQKTTGWQAWTTFTTTKP